MIGKNNPFNIRHSRGNHWRGQIGYTKGFVNFSCRQYGIRAAIYLLTWSYRRIGINTIDGIIHRFAPAVENDTERYIQFVCNRSGISRNASLMLEYQYQLVLKAMSEFEGNPVILEEITYCFDYFKMTLYDSPK